MAAEFNNKEYVSKHLLGVNMPDIQSSNILIGGAPRTGITLLQSILCSSKIVNPIIGEVAPLRFMVEAYNRTIHHTSKNMGKVFKSKEDVNSLYKKIFAIY